LANVKGITEKVERDCYKYCLMMARDGPRRKHRFPVAVQLLPETRSQFWITIFKLNYLVINFKLRYNKLKAILTLLG
jgi:hypothetical protein